MLLRTGLNNVLLPTLNNVVNNTVQCCWDNAVQGTNNVVATVQPSMITIMFYMVNKDEERCSNNV